MILVHILIVIKTLNTHFLCDLNQIEFNTLESATGIDLNERTYQLLCLNKSKFIVNNSSGEVFSILNEKIQKLNFKDRFPMRNHSTVYVNNDTIFRFGGFGYYSHRNSIEYFNFNNNKWTYYETSGEYIPSGSFYGLSFKYDNLIYLFGGYKIDFNSGFVKKNNDDFIIFDSEENKFNEIGKTSFLFENKMFLSKFDKGIFLFDNSKIYELNVIENKLITYKKPILLSSINSNNLNRYSNDSILLKLNLVDGDTLIMKSILNDRMIGESELYSKNESHFNLYVFAFLVVITLFYVFFPRKIKILKKSISYKFRNIEINEIERNILESLINNKEAKNSDLMKGIVTIPLSFPHYTRLKNQAINELNIKLKILLNKKYDVIVTTKSTQDHRENIYKLKFRSKFE